MIRKKIKLTIPQYRERKEVYEALGYKEISCIEKGINAHVVYEIDENAPHYLELKEYSKKLYRRGPTFVPIILLVVFAFVLLSVFAILFAEQKENFDLTSNAVAFLLPAFLFLFIDVIYTYIYFAFNRRIIEAKFKTKEEILQNIEIIKSK